MRGPRGRVGEVVATFTLYDSIYNKSNAILTLWYPKFLFACEDIDINCISLSLVHHRSLQPRSNELRCFSNNAKSFSTTGDKCPNSLSIFTRIRSNTSHFCREHST